MSAQQTICIHVLEHFLFARLPIMGSDLCHCRSRCPTARRERSANSLWCSWSSWDSRSHKPQGIERENKLLTRQLGRVRISQSSQSQYRVAIIDSTEARILFGQSLQGKQQVGALGRQSNEAFD